MIDLLYNALVLPLIRIGVFTSQVGSRKLRYRFKEQHAAFLRAAQSVGSPRLLFHASSMGELEQVLPIMHIIKQRMPGSCIMYSCSSPSGYAHALKQSCIDAAVFLPLDTKGNARRFFDALRPEIVIINRYDVWPNIVRAALSRSPVLLINATYPSVADSPLLGSWVSRFYRRLTHIVAVSQHDASRLTQLSGKDVFVMADTRIDRVLERIDVSVSSDNVLRSTNYPTLVVGSSWTEDEDLVFSALDHINRLRVRLIIVPHEPTEQAIARIEQKIQCARLSGLKGPYDGHIVVDSVGRLLSLYQVADAAFVGGGFGAGVHSTTEPIGYGIPVACGPHIERARDAQDYAAADLIRVVRTPQEFATWLTHTVTDTAGLRDAKNLCDDYIAARKGSALRYADMIMEHVTEAR
ncbi:MAG: 3-deoxy-D-manno-octulosonic acid transferase [Ignavibacteria bacterium]|jgi:3-deoxy-D-manno-octulosonic-acid transferase